MGKRITIIQGHPDPLDGHFCHALMQAYRSGAEVAGHEVRVITIATLNFPLVRTKEHFDSGPPPLPIEAAQQDIAWAEHLVICFPLWLGSMPALLKGFFEQALRPGFAMQGPDSRGRWKKLLKGRSAHVVVTMGMPALAYRWFFRAHSLKSLERNILRFVGVSPIRESLIGMVEGSVARREKWLARMHLDGQRAR